MILSLILYPKLITRHWVKKRRRERLCLGRKGWSTVCLTDLFITYLLGNLSFSLAEQYPDIFSCLRNLPPSVAWEEAGSTGRGWQSHILPFDDPSDREWSLVSYASPGYGIKKSSWLNSVWEIFWGVLGVGKTPVFMWKCEAAHGISRMKYIALCVWLAREWVTGFEHKTG